MILHSLNQREEEGAKEAVDREEAVGNDKKIMIQLASGIDDLGGTEVLSEEEDDPFSNNNTADKNKHFFDFELPLDSDKEESDHQNHSNSLNHSNSIDDTPLVIRIESNQEALRLSDGLRSSNTSAYEQLKNSKEGELAPL